MRWLRRIVTSMCTGYVLYFLSETVFWGRFNPETPQHEFILSWIAYSVMTYMLLTVISRFQVRRIWALFLAGAVYGWTAEGILVHTMYDSFPLQISFTGLAWHSLISVCAGWFLWRWTLAEGSARRIAGVSIAIGLFWGLWSVFWWIELGSRTPLGEYTRYAMVSGGLLVVALYLENRVQPKEFRSSAAEAWGLLLFASAWYLLTAGLFAPWTLLVLPPLMGIVFYALRSNRRRETSPDLLYELKQPIPWYRYLWVLLTPFTAVMVYAFVWTFAGQGLPTNYVVYWITTPAGFVLLVLSIYRCIRAPRSIPQKPLPTIASVPLAHSDS